MKKFGDIIYCGLSKGVVIGVEKKRKWTYYEVVFEGWDTITNDWDMSGAEYSYLREDELNDKKTNKF